MKLSDEKIQSIVSRINKLLKKEGIETYRWFTFENKIVLKVEDQ